MVQKSFRSPVEVGSLSHYLQGLSTIQTVVGDGISEPSTVYFSNSLSSCGEFCGFQELRVVHIYGILNYGGQCCAPKGVCAVSFVVEEVQLMMTTPPGN